ncbi:MAG: hypothetical protein C0497_15990 [Gemmatimonas sp.]|nr:hypothetical protein [Gemmatimonas sp.]
MSRATKVDKGRLVNAAYRLLAQQVGLAEAATTLANTCALSRRQAYRYLAQAATLSAPLPVVESTVVFTVKVPVRTVRALRAHARRKGLTLGEIVTQALTAWLGAIRRHG